ncbi:MAG: glycosyltransferase [Culicoidibacterales bacterium]
MQYLFDMLWFFVQTIASLLSDFSFIISITIFIIFIIEAYVLISARRYRKKIEDFNYDNSKNTVFTYVLIPCLNEGLVIQNTLQSFLMNNNQNIQFIVIDDASSDNTAEIVNSFSDPRLCLVQRILPLAQQGKGAALNHALNMYVIPDVQQRKLQFHDVVVAVMDADSFVEEDYFDHANILFSCNSDIEAIQSKVKIVPNTNKLWDLTHMQDLEFAVILNSMQGLRAKNANAALGGNGQFTRLTALDAVIKDGPWTDSLVEDFDLSTRLTLKNVKKIVHITNLTVFQSGVQSMGKLIRQRARWAHGNMQCNKFIPRIIKSKFISLKGKFELVYFLSKPWLVISEFFIILVVTIQILLYGIVNNDVLPLWINILMVLSLFFINFLWSAFYLLDKEIQMLHKSKPHITFITFVNGLFLSFFMLVLNFSYIFALYRLLTRKVTWDKTERTIL